VPKFRCSLSHTLARGLLATSQCDRPCSAKSKWTSVLYLYPEAIQPSTSAAYTRSRLAGHPLAQVSAFKWGSGYLSGKLMKWSCPCGCTGLHTSTCMGLPHLDDFIAHRPSFRGTLALCEFLTRKALIRQRNRARPSCRATPKLPVAALLGIALTPDHF
jgi:hypothetical protein